MAIPSVTYTFANSTTADASQVNTNFSDLISGATDGLKDYTISAITANGKAAFGAAICESSISTVVATNGGSSAVAGTVRHVILAPAGTIASYTLTLPSSPSAGQKVCIMSGGNQITSLTLSAAGGHSFATGASFSTFFPGGYSVEFIFLSNVWYRTSASVARPEAYVYATSAGGVSHASAIDLVYETESSDVRGLYNNSTGLFTVPETGVYGIRASMGTTSDSGSAGDFLAINLRYSSTNYIMGTLRVQASVTQSRFVTGYIQRKFTAAETFGIQLTFSISGGSQTTDNNGELEIVRIG